MSKKEAVKSALDDLSKDIATKAAHKDTPFSERLDAFKNLTAYYALLLKHKGKDDSDPDEPGFGQFGQAFDADEEPANGQTSVRSRRGHA